jgi:hypothetical protein
LSQQQQQPSGNPLVQLQVLALGQLLQLQLLLQVDFNWKAVAQSAAGQGVQQQQQVCSAG